MRHGKGLSRNFSFFPTCCSFKAFPQSASFCRDMWLQRMSGASLTGIPRGPSAPATGASHNSSNPGLFQRLGKFCRNWSVMQSLVAVLAYKKKLESSEKPLCWLVWCRWDFLARERLVGYLCHHQSRFQFEHQNHSRSHARVVITVVAT